MIAHQDGKLYDHQGNPNKAAIDYINQMDSLYGKDEVVIKKGFLAHAVGIYKHYFKLLNESISAEQKT